MDAPLPGQVLADQHRRIDDGVRAAAEGHGESTALADALALLRAHLYAEEAVLFPLLVEAGLAMPVFVMKREHGQMWPLVESLAAACTGGTPARALAGDCRRLFQLLQMHNPKEETIVYAAADRLAAQPAGASLAADLAAARMPDGWTCEMAANAARATRFPVAHAARP